MPRARTKDAEQVPASPPVRVEVRYNGRVRFTDLCYDPQLAIEGGAVTFSAALQPVLMDAPVLQAPQQFEFRDDPRDGEEVIQRVHSGRRDTA